MHPPFTSHRANQVASAASLGKDFSANKPALPNVGSPFANAGPYASWVLLKTIPKNNDRLCVEIHNTTGAAIAVVRDDGSAAAAAQPVNASVFALAAGAGVGEQGGIWASQTFRGRLQVYGPVALAGGAFLTVLED
jgi:hypothetical protein